MPLLNRAAALRHFRREISARYPEGQRVRLPRALVATIEAKLVILLDAEAARYTPIKTKTGGGQPNTCQCWGCKAQATTTHDGIRFCDTHAAMAATPKQPDPLPAEHQPELIEA